MSMDKTVAKLEELVKEMRVLSPILKTAVSMKKGTPALEKTKVLEPSLVSADRYVVVKTALGLTISLGEFEFARVDAGIEYPCDPKDIAESFKKAWALVEAEVQTESAGVKDASPAKRRM